MSFFVDGTDTARKHDLLVHSSKSANLGATAIMCRWKRNAVQSFGEDNELTKHYEEILKTLREQREKIHVGDESAMQEAMTLSKEINKKYGKIKEQDISKNDHIALRKPDGPI